MKQFVCLTCALCFVVSLSAQMPSLCISSNKTTSLIFPFPIKHVDRGHKEIIVQQVAEAENILLVKAASPDFSETNLSVITSDGSLYSFEVCYDPAPLVWVYQLPVQKQATMTAYANAVLVHQPVIKSLDHGKWNMHLRLTGIYIKGDVLYYQLSIQNQSSLDYSVDGLRFSIKDRKVAKRTSIQEIELHPLLIAGNATLIKAHDVTTIVVALEKHVIPDKKMLVVDVVEKGEGRSLTLRVSNKHILGATPLPELK
jgi:conjugative transposon TraN protein